MFWMVSLSLIGFFLFIIAGALWHHATFEPPTPHPDESAVGDLPLAGTTGVGNPRTPPKGDDRGISLLGQTTGSQPPSGIPEGHRAP